MPDEIKNGQEVEAQEEQPQSEEEQLEGVSTSEEPSTEQPEQEAQEAELPEDAKERTKREFEKLKQNNAELKRQLEERQQMPSVLDYPGFGVPEVSQENRQQYMQPPQVNMPKFNSQQPQQDTQPEPQLVDEQGYVNADILTKQLKQAEEARRRAEEAERRSMEAQARIAKFEQTNEEKALYEEFPELDPLNESFSREAYDLVKNELTSQIINTGKRNAVQAAQKMSKYFRSKQPSNQKVLEQRKQVSTVSGNQPRQVGTDLEELKIRSRKDPNAVAERLRRLGM